MSDREIQELLLRYRQGNCTRDEMIKIHLWYESLNSHAEVSLSENEKMILEQKLWDNIDWEMEQSSSRIYIAERDLHTSWWKSQLVKFGIAAALVLGFGFLFFFRKNQQYSALKSETLISHSKKGNILSHENKNDKPLRIGLSDHSVITLAPGGRISYPNEFSDDVREVQLEGDALFEIAKNPEKPFLVYSGKLITKVLGTSFRIKSNKENYTTEVEVLTGRVSVFENHYLTKRSKEKQHQGERGVVLTPNQKVAYYEESGHLLTSIVDEPVVIPVADTTPNLVFNNHNLSDITARLQKEYGIEIMFANERLEKCTFTGDISDMPLYDKLELICKANTACYEVKGTRILISGAGCD